MTLTVHPLQGIPEVQPGDDLSVLTAQAVEESGLTLAARDVVAVTQKVVSKAENRIVRLAEVDPSPESLRLAESSTKDVRLIEVILRESRRIVRHQQDVLIAETLHGFVCANAGVDFSNVGGDGLVTLLPLDPDGSARKLAEHLGCGIIITDTFGRPWREGLVDVAIGISRVPALVDLRGTVDRHGYQLHASILGAADALAAIAGLAMGKTQGIPAVLIRGYEWEPSDQTARNLVRHPKKDLFR
jgi:coenzyme F420-0:L-glutamate ligase/coenzyme F420-1:gamma-L-glutamate ligase